MDDVVRNDLVAANLCNSIEATSKNESELELKEAIESFNAEREAVDRYIQSMNASGRVIDLVPNAANVGPLRLHHPHPHLHPHRHPHPHLCSYSCRRLPITRIQCWLFLKCTTSRLSLVATTRGGCDVTRAFIHQYLI